MYLKDLAHKLESQYFFKDGEILHSFPSNVKNEGGSITCTQGIRIETVAQYVHCFSEFINPKYFYAYQVRISVDPGYTEQFHKCKLLVSVIFNHSCIVTALVNQSSKWVRRHR